MWRVAAASCIPVRSGRHDVSEPVSSFAPFQQSTLSGGRLPGPRSSTSFPGSRNKREQALDMCCAWRSYMGRSGTVHASKARHRVATRQTTFCMAKRRGNMGWRRHRVEVDAEHHTRGLASGHGSSSRTSASDITSDTKGPACISTARSRCVYARLLEYADVRTRVIDASSISRELQRIPCVRLLNTTALQ